MAQLQCVLVTPEATVQEMAADFVALPLFDGEIGIAPGRAPLIGRLGFGEVRIRAGDHTERYYVDGGFAHVLDGVVTVLTNQAIPSNKVNAQTAQEQLAAAKKRPIVTEEQWALKEKALLQAWAQIRVARKSGNASSGATHGGKH